MKKNAFLLFAALLFPQNVLAEQFIGHVYATICESVDMGNGFSCIDCGNGCGTYDPQTDNQRHESTFVIIDGE